MITNKENSDLLHLLKTETNLSSNFLNSFFKEIFPNKEREEQLFYITDHLAAKWLGVSNITIRERLRNKYSNKSKNDKIESKTINPKDKSESKGYSLYTELVDFIIVPTKVKNEKTYLLNYDCFRRLAMMSETEKGETLRYYFTRIEEFLKNNQSTIKQNIDKYNDLKILNKKVIKMNMKYIYVFAVDERFPDLLKIGQTSDIISRLATYNTGRIKDIDLKYLAVINEPKSIEKCIGLNLNKYRYKQGREIFKVNIEYLQEVIKDCACKFDEKLNDYETDIKGLIKYLEDKKSVSPFIVF
jgi:phage anti-repressor protein